MQKRHEEGDKRARAAAIFSSIDCIISDSAASSETEVDAAVICCSVFGTGGESAFSGREVCIVNSFVVEDLEGRVAACTSFSLCLFDWICDRYAFSVVYTLLSAVLD